MKVDPRVILVIFWLVPAGVLLVLAIFHGRAKWQKHNRAKRERMFVDLRSQGYNICDVNSNATRAKLSYMDPLTERWVWRWVDIIELGRGYGLADPINSEHN